MKRIKELRAEKGMTQQQLAELLGVVRTTISNYENEINQLDPQTIIKLCRIFSCTADYLLGLSSRRLPGISEDDAALLDAYNAAPAEIRAIVDTALAPYKEQEGSSASQDAVGGDNNGAV